MMDSVLAKYKAQIEETLSTLIPKNSPFSPSLYEGGRYALLAPGKRIRPLLTLSTAEMLQPGSLHSALMPACAIEMIHTYSLIHDDLPCMDDDDFRRGIPTLHRVYTEGHAVLVGDYLLTYAFEVIANAPSLQPEQKIALTQKLATASGAEGMIGGQIMDIENSIEIDQMHSRKTAALFCAALEFGGIIAQCSREILHLLRAFGFQFGKLFQMIDDILDSDHPLGMDKAQQKVVVFHKEAIEILHQLPFDTSALKKITELLFHSWKKAP